MIPVSIKRNIRVLVEGFKGVVAPQLKKISPSSEKFGPPKGFYTSAKQLLEQSPDKYGIRYTKVFPAERNIVSNLPGTIDGTIHARFSDHREYPIHDQYILEIDNGRVTGENCFIIAADDKIVGELSRQFTINDQFHKMAIFRSLKLPTLQTTNETVGVVGYAGGHYNYFHWMFDVLPRIGLLEKAGLIDKCDKIVINTFKLPFHEQTIQKLGLPLSKFIFSGKHLHLKAKTLIIPSIPEQQDCSPSWAIEYLQTKLNYTPADNKAVAKRIYITRKNAAKRKILQEVAIVDLLLKNEFEVHVLEGLTVEEQATLFSGSSVIIAPHGASQTNLIFCKPGTTVIELFSPEWVNFCYWNLANSLGLNYYYIMGSTNEGTGSMKNVNADINIKMDSFLQTLTLAGIAIV